MYRYNTIVGIQNKTMLAKQLHYIQMKKCNTIAGIQNKKMLAKQPCCIQTKKNV